MTTPPDPPRVHFNPEINLGSIIQVLAIAGGVAVWAISGAAHQTTTESALGQLKTDVVERFDTSHKEMSARFDAVSAQIAALPDQKARLDQAERRLNGEDSALAALDARLLNTERMAIQERSDLDNVLAASRAPLPGDRRR